MFFLDTIVNNIQRSIASAAFALALGVTHSADASLSFLTDPSTFDSVAPGLTTQTFPNQRYTLWSMSGTLDTNTSSAYGIAPGDIVPGLAISGNDGYRPADVMIAKSGWVGNSNNAVFSTSLILNLSFASGVDSIALGLLSFTGSDIRIRVYSTSNLFLGETIAPGIIQSGDGSFFGILAADGDSIGRVSLMSTTYKLIGVDFVEFGNRVQPVPEPETYGMMMAGLVLIGFIARRKKQIAA